MASVSSFQTRRSAVGPEPVLPSPRPKVPSRPAGGGLPGCGTPSWLTPHCRPQEERPPHHRYRKRGSVGGVCYLSMGMVVLLMGLVFASVYIYRYFFLAQVRPGGERVEGRGRKCASLR